MSQRDIGRTKGFIKRQWNLLTNTVDQSEKKAI